MFRRRHGPAAIRGIDRRGPMLVAVSYDRDPPLETNLAILVGSSNPDERERNGDQP